jgi:hypothetical protein
MVFHQLFGYLHIMLMSTHAQLSQHCIVDTKVIMEVLPADLAFHFVCCNRQ